MLQERVHLEPSGSRATARGPSAPVEILSLLLLGGALVAVAGPVTALLQRLLPRAATVSSAGTQYPSFGDAFPVTLRSIGFVLLLVTFAPLVRGSRPLRWVQDHPVQVATALAGLAFTVYAWLAYPHNAFPSNARIHWVDIFFAPRADNYFYALVKLPHRVFYDYPHVLQGALGAANYLLLFAVGRRLLPRALPALGLALAYLISAQMLLFANGGEDVTLNVTLLLLSIWALSHRSGLLIGGTLFLVTLGRPQFVLLACAFFATQPVCDLAAAGPGASWSARLGVVRSDRMLRTAVLAFGFLFAGWHAFLAAIDASWLLVDSQVLDTGLLDLRPREIDGYTIRPYSGAYLLHALWVIPVPVLAANGIVAARFRALGEDQRRVAAVLWVFVATTVLLSEHFVLYYYNIRYLSYLLPLLLVGAWLVFANAQPRASRMAAIGAALLLLSPAAGSHQELPRHAALAAQPLAQLFPDRLELRRLTSDREVATTIESHTHRNYLAYLVRRPHGDIAVVEPATAPSGAVVFTTSMEGFDEARVLYRGESIFLVSPE